MCTEQYANRSKKLVFECVQGTFINVLGAGWLRDGCGTAPSGMLGAWVKLYRNYIGGGKRGLHFTLLAQKLAED